MTSHLATSASNTRIHVTLTLAIAAAASCSTDGSRREAAPAERVEREPVIILTGFEPFAGLETNTSWEVAKRLDGETIEGMRVVSAMIPVVWNEARDSVASAVAEHSPDIAVVMGVAWRGVVSVESTARNVRSESKDNRRELPTAKRVYADAPPRLKTRLPADEIVARLAEMNIPARASDGAGAYLCNEVFYAVLHQTRSTQIPAGLIHLPRAGPDRAKRATPEEAKVRAVTLEEVVEAVREALAVTARLSHANPSP